MRRLSLLQRKLRVYPADAPKEFLLFAHLDFATTPLPNPGASVASFVVEPRNTVSMGASGAVFGLFAVAVLLKLRFNFRKLVECLVLGQFVVKQVLQVRIFRC